MSALQKPPTVNDDYRAQDIYRRAAKIIHEKGFDSTSMGDIADSVDLTKGGLYYYIKGKRALLYAIMNFAMDLLEERVVKPALADPDPESRLSRLVSGHIQLMLDEPSAMSILVHEDEGLDAEHRQKIQARKQEYPRLFADSIAEVLEAQGRDTLDPTIAAYSVLGMIHWIGRWYRPDGRLGEEQIVDQLTRLALHGVLPERRRAAHG